MQDNQDVIYDTLDATQPKTEVGYEATPAGHAFSASQHEQILNAKDANPAETSDFAKATASLERATLKLRLSLDAAEVMGAHAQAYANEAAKHTDPTGTMPNLAAFTASRLASQQKMAMENPEKAAAIAVVEAVAPVGTPEATKTAAAFMEYKQSTIAKVLKDKAWVFSPDSYVADFAAMLANPVRTIFGQTQAGTALGMGKAGYYELLKEWHTLPQAVQEQLWDPLVEKLKEASGDNDLVFVSLANPFVSEDKVDEAYVDSVFDLIDTGSTAVALGLAMKARASLSASRRALALGNAKEAGKANAAAIAKGDPAAVVEGSPIPHPLGQPGMSVPTQLHIEEVARQQGKLAEGESIVTQAPALDAQRTAQAVEARNSAVVARGGTIISNDVGTTGVDITFSVVRPTGAVRWKDIFKARAWVNDAIIDTENELKLLVLGNETGANTDKVADLSTKLQGLKTSRVEIEKGVESGMTTITTPFAYEREVKKVFFGFTQDDAGKLNMTDAEVGSYTHILGTQESRVGKLMDGLVSLGTNMRQQQRRLFGYFDKDIRKLRRELKSAGKNAGPEVDALLHTGDRLQKYYTVEELRAGTTVDGVGFKTFSDVQIDAYQRIRKGYDDLYVIANRMQADELTFSGHEAFRAKYIDTKGVAHDIQVFGKTGGTNAIKYVKPSISQAMDLRVSSATKGTPIKLSSVTDLGDGLNNKKLGFIKLHKPLEQGDGSKFTHALVEVDDFGDFSKVRGANKVDQVLDYRKGYVPKMAAENIRWIVEVPKVSRVDGVEISDTQILRGFETESEAKIYLDQLKLKNPESKAYSQEVNTAWRSNLANKEKVEFLDNRLFRGAFAGHRHENATFRVGLDGHEAKRVSSFDALQRYADYVAAYAPMHQFKQSMVSQFLATAKNGDGSSMLAIAGRWDSQLSGSGDDYVRLKAVQDWMKTVFAVPTTEEMYFTRVTDRLLKSLERAIYDAKGIKPGREGLKGLHHWIATSRSAQDPVSYMKGITFDLMLGSFNPAQFFVQTAGMFIPATLHPIRAAAAMPDFMFMRHAMYAKDYKAAAAAGAKMGYNPKRMHTMLHAWHRSGIPDSILENADFGHYAGTQGAYYSPSMFNTMRERSRLFYNAGEINNRLFSFTVAFNDVAKRNKWDLTKTLTDAQINEVVKEGLRIGTNMTAGNKAKWQDGVLGMPTQFWQQTHKYYENLFYGAFNDTSFGKRHGIVKENQWTKTESATALAMNVIGFGAAGFGLDEFVSDFDRYLTSDPQGLQLDPEKDKLAIATLRGGLLEAFMLEAVGHEVDIADRTGPSNGAFLLYEKIYKPLSEAAMEGKIAEGVGKVLFGATGTTLGRIYEANKRFATTMIADGRNMEWDEGTLLATAGALFSPLSSYTQLERALAWKAANDILNTRGVPLQIIQDGTEIPTSVVLLKALGFDPLAKEKMEKLIRQDRMRETDKASIVQNLTADYRSLFSNPVEGTLVEDAQQQLILRRIAMRKDALLETYGPTVTNEIMRRLIDNLDKESKQYGFTSFQKKLFESVLKTTPESEIEKELRADLALSRGVAQIKGNPVDAE